MSGREFVHVICFSRSGFLTMETRTVPGSDPILAEGGGDFFHRVVSFAHYGVRLLLNLLDGGKISGAPGEHD